MTAAREQPELEPPRRPIFAMTIEYTGDAGFDVHALRRLLKRLIRDCRFRVRSIEEIEGPR